MKRYILFGILLLASGVLYAQAVVTGIVTDSRTQEPMPGVTVMSSDKKGVMTDYAGAYSISVAEGSSLTFSFMGYASQTVQISGRQVVNISLSEDAQEMETIVVVGVAVKKSDLTGAVSSVSSKELEEKPVTTINEAIQGRMAGVFVNAASKPGDDAKIKIRGTNTIRKDGYDPIYVVDGLVLESFKGGFNAINVNDVASVQVLKDASATALYGSRGANGVVLVTTKKGRAGQGRVTYDTWVGVQTFAKNVKMMDTRQLYQLRKDSWINGYVQLNGDQYLNDWIVEKLDDGFDVFARYEKEAYRDNKNYDWVKEVTQPGLQQDHALSFSGGTEKGSYFLSFNYSDQDGLVKNTGLTKYSGRINAEQEIKPWLRVGTNTTFQRTVQDKVDDYVLENAWKANPMFAISDTVLTLDYQARFNENHFNPIRSLMIKKQDIRNRFLSNSYINISPIEGLNIRTSFAIDFMTEARFEFTPQEVYESIRYGSDGAANHARDHRTMWQWDNSISYDKSFGKHRINALLSTSASCIDHDWTEVGVTGFNTSQFLYKSLGAAYKTDRHRVSSEWVTATMMSYVARGTYSFADRYHFTGTLRADGSSKFIDGKRWGVFPAGSFKWDVLKEAFIPSQNIFSDLGLRLGYGVVGNQNVDDYRFQNLYDTRISNGTATYVPNEYMGNPNFTWEKQQQGNLGLDMAFLNHRIRFTVDAFLIYNKDLLLAHEVNKSTGYRMILENVGTIENKGVELSLNANLVRKADFEWNAALTFSLDRNKVSALYGRNPAMHNIEDGQVKKDNNLFVGEARNTLYMWKTGGIAQADDFSTDAEGRRLFRGQLVDYAPDGKYVKNYIWSSVNVSPGDLFPVDANGDGTITEDDRVIVGSTDPKFYGGFSTDASWKGISINAVFTYAYGAKKLSPYYESLMGSTGSSSATVDLVDRWTPQNPDAKFPRPIAGFDYPHFTTGQMDFSVQEASFLRLSALTLAYTFPKNLTDKVKLSNLRLYFTGSNLFCLTPYKGYDPEMGDWYPATRMYVFGLNLSF